MGSSSEDAPTDFYTQDDFYTQQENADVAAVRNFDYVPDGRYETGVMRQTDLLTQQMQSQAHLNLQLDSASKVYRRQIRWKDYAKGFSVISRCVGVISA